MRLALDIAHRPCSKLSRERNSRKTTRIHPASRISSILKRTLLIRRNNDRPTRASIWRALEQKQLWCAPITRYAAAHGGIGSARRHAPA